MTSSKRPGRSKRSSEKVDDEAYTDANTEAEQTDVDELASAGEFEPFSRKRKVKTKSAKPKVRRRPDLEEGTTPDKDISPSLYALGEFRIKPSYYTPILNDWVAARSELKVKEAVLPAKIGLIDFAPIEELEDVSGRNFQYKVELVNVEVNWDPLEDEVQIPTKLPTADQLIAIVKYHKTIPTWKVQFWNEALPSQGQEILTLFPHFLPTKTKAFYASEKGGAYKPKEIEKFFHRGGLLDINVCPSEAVANRIGAEACRLFNKLPFSIKASHFPEEINLSKQSRHSSIFRQLIELSLLRKLDGNFDFRRLRGVFKNTLGGYRLDTQITIGRTTSKTGTTLYKVSLPFFVTRDPSVSTEDPMERTPNLNLSDSDLTKEALDALPNVPDWWDYRIVQPEKVPDKPRITIESITKFVNYIAWTTFGFVATMGAMSTAIYMEIEALANLPVSKWQALNSNIDAPFTEDEIHAICAELNGEGKLTYYESAGGFTYHA